MENEQFTFVVCSHTGHTTQTFYCNRAEADAKFTALSAEAEKHPEGDYVAYYCASSGGLVNSYRV